MIKYVKDGNIFEDNHNAIVCTTNCVGVMGKGIALEFKQRFPKFFNEYKEYCKECKPKGGDCMIFHNQDYEKPSYLITVMTKEHWFNPSKLEWIHAGLEDLVGRVETINEMKDRKRIESLGLPALGCSNGGLQWDMVKPLIEKHLSNVDINITVYEPREKTNASN